MAAIHAKSQKENLSAADQKLLATVAAQIKRAENGMP